MNSPASRGLAGTMKSNQIYADNGGGNLIAAKRRKKHKKFSSEDGIAARDRKEHKKENGKRSDFSACFSGADDLLRRS